LCVGNTLRLSTTNAALQWIGRLAPSMSLLGESALDQALVESWLSYFWSSVDLPLQVAQQQSSSSKDDLTQAWNRINHHLAQRTYLVGHSVTVADIGLVVSLAAAAQAGVWESSLDSHSSTPHLARWYDTMIHQEWYTTDSSASSSTKASSSSRAMPVTPSASSGNGVQMHGPPPPVTSRLYRRERVRIKELLQTNDSSSVSSYLDQTVTVAGWARSVRKQGKLLFVALNDGSTATSLQCVLHQLECEGFDDCKNSGGTGASFQLTGKVIASQGEGQSIELQVSHGTLLGAVYAGNAEGTEIGGMLYPMAKKEHTLEYLREQAHLRARTNLHAAAMRIRHAMAFATHNFFHNHGFLYIHTPILTGADCEGAGEQFAVTSLLTSDHHNPQVTLPKHQPPEPTEEKKLSKSEQKRLAKQKEKNKPDPFKPIEEAPVVGAVDYSHDFFHQRVNLTVSGQLNVETHACALCDVYTFGPTFRAEYSFTSRHLSEFWMIEPEIAFADLEMDINLAEDYLKYCVQYALENCADDLEVFENNPHGEKGLRDRLRNVLESPFEVSLYKDGVENKRAKNKLCYEEYNHWESL
jgi:aspartyl/asparaginyl-tRNA synthetase